MARVMRSGPLLLLAFAMAVPVIAADDPLATATSRAATAAFDPALESAARQLWTKDVDAPVVVADPATRRAMRAGSRDAVEPVELPADMLLANTCIRLADGPSALLLLPLPEDEADLRALVWHERWHCAQDALGLPAREADTAHLDGEASRTWLRLELRALAAAIRAASTPERRDAARAALAFRARRGALAPGAAAQEAMLERNEALAEYTGRRLALPPAAMRRRLADALERGDGARSHVRSFAYLTGPAYGALLDEFAPGWRTRLDASTDIAAELASALAPAPGEAGIAAASTRFGAGAVMREERERALRQQERVADLRRRLVDGPVLRLPLKAPNVSFDPNTLVPLGEAGTAYAPFELSDAWGRLKSTGPVLLAADWSLARVEALDAEPCAGTLRTASWTLALAPRWRVARRDGALTVEPGEAPACR